MSNLLNLKKGVADSSDILNAVTVMAANGAIPVQSGIVVITKGSAAALTLAAPTVAQNGTYISVVSTTGYAHTVTQTTPGFNNGSTASDVATFGAAAGNCLCIMAWNGAWYTESLAGVTLG